MGLFDFFRRNKKQRYIVDKTQVDKAYIENRLQFLVDSGYKYQFYQKNWESEFIYTLQECCVEVFLDGYVFDCVIQTKDFTRANITQNPLVDSYFKERFFRAINLERIDMVVNMLHENADAFLLKRDFLEFPPPFLTDFYTFWSLDPRWECRLSDEKVSQNRLNMG